ncbi:MAG: glycosyltransferase [Lachnospiraceae bacterium]|nr:glycosyltransferase [Lachnospiraceae bacterium]
MEETIRFSIIIPAYNAAKALPHLIQSIEKQTYAPHEVLFINDCSTDDTAMILDDLAKDSGHQGWRAYHQPKNSGVSACRNKGIDLASGDYILFMDADDWIEPNLLEKVAFYLQNQKPDVLAFGVFEDYLDQEQSIYYSNTHTLEKRLAEEPVDFAKMIYDLERETLYGYPWNKVYRTSLLQENHIQFPAMSFSEDFFFNAKVYDHAASAMTIPEVLYHYQNQTGDRLTDRYVPDYFSIQRRRYTRVLEQIVGRLTLDVATSLTDAATSPTDMATPLSETTLYQETLELLAGRYFRSFASMINREIQHGASKAQILDLIEQEMTGFKTDAGQILNEGQALDAEQILNEERSLFTILSPHLDKGGLVTEFLYRPLAEGRGRTAYGRMMLFHRVKRLCPRLYNRLKQNR